MFLQVARENFNLSPGMGLGTQAWNPEEGLRREAKRREATGASAAERIQALQDAGVTDRAGMTAVFERLYASPEQAFMLARRT